MAISVTEAITNRLGAVARVAQDVGALILALLAGAALNSASEKDQRLIRGYIRAKGRELHDDIVCVITGKKAGDDSSGTSS